MLDPDAIREDLTRAMLAPEPRIVRPEAILLIEAAAYGRTDQAAMSDELREAFKNCVLELVRTGEYATLVSDHMDMSHVMHGSMGAKGLFRFLPWHRRYLVEFERKLRAVDRQLRPTATDLVTIPYWRWTDPFPAWLTGFLPQKDPDTDKPPGKRRTKAPPSKPNASDVKVILEGFGNQLPGQQVNDYVRFTYGLEGWGRRPDGSSLPAHNHVHDWVGGIMSNTSTSPVDPVFWLHHAEVDRLWAVWQATHDSHPHLEGADGTMDPWPETYADVVDTVALGYRYV